MKKFIALLFVGVLLTLWSSCFDDPTGTTTVTITIESIGAVVINGAAGEVVGEIEADEALTSVTMKVLDSQDQDVTANFTVNFTSAYVGLESVKLKDDMSTTVAAKQTATAGTYKLQITAAAGDVETISSKAFPVTGGGTPVTIATLQAGANQHTTLGSAIDLDEPKAMLKAEADQNVSKIDICYAYSGTDAVEKFFSPHHAKLSGYTFAQDWATPNESKFYITTLTPAQYNAITTKEQLAQEWTEPANPATSVACAKDDVFIAKTEQGVLVLILVTDQVAGATGTIDIKIAK